jgi:hypothetical protein
LCTSIPTYSLLDSLMARLLIYRLILQVQRVALRGFAAA